MKRSKDGGRDLSAQSLSSHITWTEHQPAEEKKILKENPLGHFSIFFFLFINFFQATKNWTKNIFLFFPLQSAAAAAVVSVYLSLAFTQFISGRLLLSDGTMRWKEKGAIFSRWIFFLLIFHSDSPCFSLNCCNSTKNVWNIFSADTPPSSRPGQRVTDAARSSSSDEFFREITALNSFKRKSWLRWWAQASLYKDCQIPY